MSYKHILLATDLTSDNESIGAKALDVARRYKAKLSIFHAQNIPVTYGGGEFMPSLEIELEANLEKDVSMVLAKQAEELGIAEQDRWLIVGSTKDALLKLIDELKVDLLVIGSRDAHGLNLLFGSTTDRILHKVPCDVLAVRLKK